MIVITATVAYLENKGNVSESKLMSFEGGTSASNLSRFINYVKEVERGAFEHYDVTIINAYVDINGTRIKVENSREIHVLAEGLRVFAWCLANDL
jgi:hypothetical protein